MERYKLERHVLFTENRDKDCIILEQGTVVVKIKDTFWDKLKLRNMFRIEDTGVEVDINEYAIANYFRRI